MNKNFRHPIAIAALVLMATVPFSADAATVGVIFDSSMTSDPNAAAIQSTINSVVGSYETLLLNPIHITVTFKAMASGLGLSSYTPVTDHHQWRNYHRRRLRWNHRIDRHRQHDQ